MTTSIIIGITVVLSVAFYWLGRYEERCNAADDRAARDEALNFAVALANSHPDADVAAWEAEMADGGRR